MAQVQENQPRPPIVPQRKRIVSLLPAATEIICFLGLEDRLVGVSHQCGNATTLAGKPRVTFSSLSATAGSEQIDAEVRSLMARGEPLYGINEEVLATLMPELIVTQAQCDVCAVRYEDVLAAARRIAPDGSIEVVSLKPSTLEDILQDILRVGRSAGVEDIAAERVAGLRQRIAVVRNAAQAVPASQRPRVAVIEWAFPLMIAANWTPELVEMAGAEYGLAQAGNYSTGVLWEELRGYDPQALLVSICGFDLPRTLVEIEVLRRMPGWDSLNAVCEGRVWALDGDVHLNCPSPGVVDTLELLGHLLHPERMPAPELIRSNTWHRL
ncbi:MAG: ABC transporter substrate-binding protein [Planctomycetes bacterium]|nr:ABC transporter substrate-binding protein [Planctomycetota bacterium]